MAWSIFMSNSCCDAGASGAGVVAVVAVVAVIAPSCVGCAAAAAPGGGVAGVAGTATGVGGEMSMGSGPGVLSLELLVGATTEAEAGGTTAGTRGVNKVWLRAGGDGDANGDGGGDVGGGDVVGVAGKSGEGGGEVARSCGTSAAPAASGFSIIA